MKKLFPAMKPRFIAKAFLPGNIPAFVFAMILLSTSLLLTSCKKENAGQDAIVSKNAQANNNLLGQEKKIYVTTVAELYTAVNDQDNAGSTVVIAAGNYVLDPTYPNGGRLELQTDMTLQGQPGQTDQVLIDQSALPTASFVIPAGRTGGIRVGKGTNTIEWLSIKGGALSAAPFSVINTDLFSTECYVNISHVFIEGNGSNIGINLRNRLAEHAGRKIYSELNHNELTGFINANGFALAFQNANGASESLIKVNMKENYIHGNKIGILAFNTAQNTTLNNSVIEIVSHFDRIEGNGVGIDPTGGVLQTGTAVCNGNTTTLKMYGSSISNNNPPLSPQLQPVNGALPGAMFVSAAYNTVNNITGFNKASDNKMIVECYGCDISNNNGTDIWGYGAFCFPAAVLAGSNNLLEIYLFGISANAIVDAVASSPVEPAGTNVANVFR